MTRDLQRLPDYLDHIGGAIRRIQRYVDGKTDRQFLEDEMLQDAVIRNFEIIGEASRNIVKHYPDFVAANPGLPLLIAYEMRNALAHGYFKVDYQIVWNTIQNELAGLHQQVDSLVVALREADEAK